MRSLIFSSQRPFENLLAASLHQHHSTATLADTPGGPATGGFPHLSPRTGENPDRRGQSARRRPAREISGAFLPSGASGPRRFDEGRGIVTVLTNSERAVLHAGTRC